MNKILSLLIIILATIGVIYTENNFIRLLGIALIVYVIFISTCSYLTPKEKIKVNDNEKESK